MNDNSDKIEKTEADAFLEENALQGTWSTTNLYNFAIQYGGFLTEAKDKEIADLKEYSNNCLNRVSRAASKVGELESEVNDLKLKLSLADIDTNNFKNLLGEKAQQLEELKQNQEIDANSHRLNYRDCNNELLAVKEQVKKLADALQMEFDFRNIPAIEFRTKYGTGDTCNIRREKTTNALKEYNNKL